MKRKPKNPKKKPLAISKKITNESGTCCIMGSLNTTNDLTPHDGWTAQD